MLVVAAPFSQASHGTSCVTTRVHTPPGSEATTRLKYEVPTRALLGLRHAMLTATKGTALLNTNLIG